MSRWLAYLPLAALAVLVVVGVVLLTRGGERENFTAGMIGRPAPAYALAALDGGDDVSGETRAGRAYIVNVFASWCAPCRAEHPLLMTLQQSGVEIVGVAYKDQPQNAARFLAELGDPYDDVGLDPDGRFALELGLIGVPETYVIGADGRIRAVFRGPLTQGVVEQELLPALR